MRTDEDRLRKLKLMKLQNEAERLGRERALLQVELAPIVMTAGWHDPAALALVERIEPIRRAWEKVVKEIRQVQAEGQA